MAGEIAASHHGASLGKGKGEEIMSSSGLASHQAHNSQHTAAESPSSEIKTNGNKTELAQSKLSFPLKNGTAKDVIGQEAARQEQSELSSGPSHAAGAVAAWMEEMDGSKVSSDQPVDGALADLSRIKELSPSSSTLATLTKPATTNGTSISASATLLPSSGASPAGLATEVMPPPPVLPYDVSYPPLMPDYVEPPPPSAAQKRKRAAASAQQAAASAAASLSLEPGEPPPSYKLVDRLPNGMPKALRDTVVGKSKPRGVPSKREALAEEGSRGPHDSTASKKKQRTAGPPKPLTLSHPRSGSRSADSSRIASPASLTSSPAPPAYEQHPSSSVIGVAMASGEVSGAEGGADVHGDDDEAGGSRVNSSGNGDEATREAETVIVDSSNRGPGSSLVHSLDLGSLVERSLTGAARTDSDASEPHHTAAAAIAARTALFSGVDEVRFAPDGHAPTAYLAEQLRLEADGDETRLSDGDPPDITMDDAIAVEQNPKQLDNGESSLLTKDLGTTTGADNSESEKPAMAQTTESTDSPSRTKKVKGRPSTSSRVARELRNLASSADFKMDRIDAQSTEAEASGDVAETGDASVDLSLDSAQIALSGRGGRSTHRRSAHTKPRVAIQWGLGFQKDYQPEGARGSAEVETASISLAAAVAAGSSTPSGASSKNRKTQPPLARNGAGSGISSAHGNAVPSTSPEPNGNAVSTAALLASSSPSKALTARGAFAPMPAAGGGVIVVQSSPSTSALGGGGPSTGVASGNAGGEDGNNELCDVCQLPGHFVCCDNCPRSFHFMCLNPPLEMNEMPPSNGPEADSWFCNVCAAAANRKASKKPQPPQKKVGLFGPLIKHIEGVNPSVFSLSPELRGFFKGVATAPDGSYINAAAIRPLKLTKQGFIEDRDPYRLKDKNGHPVVCFHCAESALPPAGHAGLAASPRRSLRRSPSKSNLADEMDDPHKGWRKILSCDFCALHWHLDCLTPTLSGMPSFVKKWMCPNHIQHVIPSLRIPKTTGANNSVDTIDLPVPSGNTVGPGKHYRVRVRNDGDIDIIPDPMDQFFEREQRSTDRGWDELVMSRGQNGFSMGQDSASSAGRNAASQRQRYRIPEKVVRLDFWSRVRGSVGNADKLLSTSGSHLGRTWEEADTRIVLPVVSTDLDALAEVASRQLELFETAPAAEAAPGFRLVAAEPHAEMSDIRGGDDRIHPVQDLSRLAVAGSHAVAPPSLSPASASSELTDLSSEAPSSGDAMLAVKKESEGSGGRAKAGSEPRRAKTRGSVSPSPSVILNGASVAESDSEMGWSAGDLERLDAVRHLIERKGREAVLLRLGL